MPIGAGHPRHARTGRAAYPSGSDLPVTNYQLNREYVTIKNTGTTTRTLTGWTGLDPANHVYTFPTFKLGAGKSVKLHTGEGTNSSTNLYWGRGYYVWNNTGDKAILHRVAADDCRRGLPGRVRDMAEPHMGRTSTLV
jgi:hypothetical protein